MYKYQNIQHSTVITMSINTPMSVSTTPTDQKGR